MTDNASARAVVAVVNDLIFASKVRGTAAHVGVDVVFARSAAALHEQAAGARLVLLDLEAAWMDAPSEIQRLKTDPATTGVTVVAFGSHLQTERLTAARAAGADRVMARSAFVSVLPQLLTS